MAGDDDDVPRLPRGRGLKLDFGQVMRIVFTAGMLVLVVVATKPCSHAVSQFINGFSGSGSGARVGSGASTAMPKPGNVDLPATAPGGSDDITYVELHPGMTDDEVRAAIAKARGSARPASADAGSGMAPNAPPWDARSPGNAVPASR